MEKLLEKFKTEYKFLYENDNVAGYSDAIEEFDYLNDAKDQKFIKLLQEFASYRQDYITSDREAAAFMFAAVELEYL